HLPTQFLLSCLVSTAGAWSVLCAGHHNNRVRGCDLFGCGGFNSRRSLTWEGVFRSSGKVAQGYSSRKGRSSSHLPYVNSPFLICMTEYCVKIFNIRPYRYMGPISQGEALGYLLPLQERFSGITSHMELQMCDRSDPSPYV
uniref:Si:ch1073-204b8.1 n=1 Tax=Hucho hucho TaxID=62062 RepID=A0A4W5MWZ5_9TELE